MQTFLPVASCGRPVARWSTVTVDFTATQAVGIIHVRDESSSASDLVRGHVVSTSGFRWQKMSTDTVYQGQLQSPPDGNIIAVDLTESLPRLSTDTVYQGQLHTPITDVRKKKK